METQSQTTDSNLLCFLYGAAKEDELCQQFIRDADANHDSLLVEFFKEIQAQDRLRIYRIEEFLHRQAN